MEYPARFEPASEGGFVVTFRDIPEAITQGDDEHEAMSMAEDALATALDFYLEDRRSLPLPSSLQEGERYVALPLASALTALRLHVELLEAARQAAVPLVIWWAMVEAQEILAEKPIEDNATILGFMGSGASTSVTAGQLRALSKALAA